MTKPLRLLMVTAFLVAGTAAITLSTAGATSRPSVVSPHQWTSPTTQTVFARWSCGPSFCRLPATHLLMYLSPGYYDDTLEGHTSPYLRCSVVGNIEDVNFIVQPDASNTEDGFLHVFSDTAVRFGCRDTLDAAGGEGTMFVVTRSSYHWQP